MQAPGRLASGYSLCMCGEVHQTCKTLDGTASASSTASAHAYRYEMTYRCQSSRAGAYSVACTNPSKLTHTWSLLTAAAGDAVTQQALVSCCLLLLCLSLFAFCLCFAVLQANKAGADEGLMLDPHGFVCTCNSVNFFIIREGEVSRCTGFTAMCCTNISSYVRNWLLWD
eukprot:GHRR01022114.1.p1 GENE.GHRR01022114.1~~GHRR01022114.1.p1  ORF type:complete len:170 (+),score=27.39 GHRR01022114.1:810-1319(+)